MDFPPERLVLMTSRHGSSSDQPCAGTGSSPDRRSRALNAPTEETLSSPFRVTETPDGEAPAADVTEQSIPISGTPLRRFASHRLSRALHCKRLHSTHSRLSAVCQAVDGKREPRAAWVGRRVRCVGGRRRPRTVTGAPLMRKSRNGAAMAWCLCTEDGLSSRPSYCRRAFEW